MKAKNKVIPILNIAQYCTDRDVWNIKVSSFSEEACTIAEFDEKHRHDYYEIIWLRKGKGTHMIDGIDYAYNGSVLFLLSPGQMHHIKPQEKADGYVVKFLPSLFKHSADADTYLTGNNVFDNIQAQPLLKVTSSLYAVLDDVFGKLTTEFNTDEQDKERIMLSYLQILITHIERLKRTNRQDATNPIGADYNLFQQYKSAVEKYFRQEHGVQQYADRLFTQTRTLNTIAKKYAGKNAAAVIADRIVLEAQRDLYHNIKTIKEIGYDLGFDDPAYFTRFFKKQTGYSPLEYKMHRSEKSIVVKAG